MPPSTFIYLLKSVNGKNFSFFYYYYFLLAFTLAFPFLLFIEYDLLYLVSPSQEYAVLKSAI